MFKVVKLLALSVIVILTRDRSCPPGQTERVTARPFKIVGRGFPACFSENYLFMIKAAQLNGADLDYWVARAEGLYPMLYRGQCYASDNVGDDFHQMRLYTPSKDWAQGGPILERLRLKPEPRSDQAGWRTAAPAAVQRPLFYQVGQTLLESAMRCYVAFKFGAEFDAERPVPYEIRQQHLIEANPRLPAAVELSSGDRDAWI